MPVQTVLNLDVHATLATELTRNRESRCLTYWKIGRQLNLEYGAPDGNWIPGTDMEKLTDLYGVHNSYISAFRRFASHPESDTVTRAKAIATEYRSWSGVMKRFLRGLSPDAPIYVPQQSQPLHGFVVPEAAVDGFAARFGWSHGMAQKTMRELSRDTDWLVNVFAMRARRDGHRPVSDG